MVQVQRAVSFQPAGEEALSKREHASSGLQPWPSGSSTGYCQGWLQDFLTLCKQLKVKRGMRPDEVVKPLSTLHLESRCLVQQHPGASSGQALWSRADSWWLPRARTDMTYPTPSGNYPELSSPPPFLLCCFLREGLGISHQ